MSQDNTQPEGSSDVPNSLDQALKAPQAAPAVGSGPDSHNLPRSVEAQTQVETVPKERHDGLMSKYQSEKATWEQRFDQLQETVKGLVESMASQVAGEVNATQTPSPPGNLGPPRMGTVRAADAAGRDRRAVPVGARLIGLGQLVLRRRGPGRHPELGSVAVRLI